MLERIVRKFSENARVAREGALDVEYRVTIGRRFRHEIRADLATGAGPVFDDDLLPEQLSQPRRHNAREIVGAAAGCERHDDAHGAIRIFRGVRRQYCERNNAERQYALAEAAWRTDAPEPRNLARFLAERGDKIVEAVEIAETAAKARHDIFTEDALAWAYFRAGRIDDAKRAIQLALRTGTRDRDILRHAREIGSAPTQRQDVSRASNQ